jgi:hypothetical protein
MNDKKPHHGHKWMPVVYATFFGIIKEIAEKNGYALAIHGSMTNDFDLVAIPWVEKPKHYLTMLKEIAEKIDNRYDRLPYDTTEEKPHNRIAFTIGTGGGGYLDISIIKPDECEMICDACNEPILDNEEFIIGEDCNLHKRCADGLNT